MARCGWHLVDLVFTWRSTYDAFSHRSSFSACVLLKCLQRRCTILFSIAE